MTVLFFSDRAIGATAPRRVLYRRVKHALRRLLTARWCERERSLEHVVRRFLAPLSARELSRLLRERRAVTIAAALLLASRAATAEPPISLSAVAAGTGGFVINGIDPGDYSGWSVSGAGDVNGDGIDDLVIGAARADPGGDSQAGESYVVFGKAGTAAVDLAAVAAGAGGGFVMNGVDTLDRSGASVSGAGDVNGDGLDDVIVGAYGGDPPGAGSAGESYVVFGKASSTPLELADIAVGSGGFVINGIETSDQSGRSVSGAGDVNGDGLDDLVIGAFQADPSGFNSGESYVVFGKANTTPVQLATVAAGTGGFAIYGTAQLDQSGRSVSGAGDVNGDGLDDVIIGADSANVGGDFDAGKSYVVFGKASTTPVVLAAVATGSGGFVINGIDAEDHSGFGVSGAGDVNGDGLDDLIVGAYAADPDGDSVAGESYVVFGKASTAPVELTAVAGGTGGFVINGIDPGDLAGWSVSGAGDFNGDGLADLIVGAWGADHGGNSEAGESYVIFGKASSTPVALATIAAGSEGFAINGIDSGDNSGFSVSGAGDVNGDGNADLIIGARLADPGGGLDAGESYVIFAPAPPCPADFDDSGDVGFNDLTMILLNWGACPPACPLDLDGSGDVGFGDLTLLLIDWGPC